MIQPYKDMLRQAETDLDAARAEIERLTKERDEARAQVAFNPTTVLAGATETPRAWLDVMGERVRQITAEGWTADHDDAHNLGQMAGAALCYLAEDIPHWARQQAHGCYWPWDAGWWKPGDHRRNLVKAGALILAEIERLDRATRPANAHDARPAVTDKEKEDDHGI